MLLSKEGLVIHLWVSLIFPLGIQFQILRMRANDSADANDPSNPYRAENIELERLLELHSEENHDDVCLAYLFTYRDFGNGALGLSWQGEIGE